MTAVEQPVGLMLDKSRGLVLGSELVVNGTFDVDANWTKYSGWGIADGKATKTPGTAGTLVQPYALTPGKTYKVTYEVSNRTAGQCTAVFVGGTTVAEGVHSNNGFRSCILTAVTGNGTFGISADSLFNGSIDNFSIRELPGWHASQITATSRPVLSARVNLLTKTEDFSHSDWGQQNNYAYESATDPEGGNTATKITSIGAAAVTRRALIATSATIDYTIYVKAGTHEPVVMFRNATTATILITASKNGSNTYGTWTTTPIADGWKKVKVSVTSGVTAGNQIEIYYGAPGALAAGLYWYVWHPDVRPANTSTNLPDYQRVNTATDYDTAGFPYYLKFELDDWLVTPSINFTGTDKMMVCAGVRKLSDAALGMIAELSVNASIVSYPGAFYLVAPHIAGNASYQYNSRGGAGQAAPVATGFVAPITNVVTGISKIQDSVSEVRVNGAFVASNSATQGTGTYGNYPLYIGHRAGTSLPFNGHLYSLIIRGAATSDSQIKSVERYVNTKTRAYTS